MFPHGGTGERSRLSQPPRLLSRAAGYVPAAAPVRSHSLPRSSLQLGAVRMHIISSSCDPSQSAEQMYLSSPPHLPRCILGSPNQYLALVVQKAPLKLAQREDESRPLEQVLA